MVAFNLVNILGLAIRPKSKDLKQNFPMNRKQNTFCVMKIKAYDKRHEGYHVILRGIEIHGRLIRRFYSRSFLIESIYRVYFLDLASVFLS